MISNQFFQDVEEQPLILRERSHQLLNSNPPLIDFWLSKCKSGIFKILNFCCVWLVETLAERQFKGGESSSGDMALAVHPVWSWFCYHSSWILSFTTVSNKLYTYKKFKFKNIKKQITLWTEFTVYQYKLNFVEKEMNLRLLYQITLVSSFWNVFSELCTWERNMGTTNTKLGYLSLLLYENYFCCCCFNV